MLDVKQAIKSKCWSVNDPRWLIEVSKYLDSSRDWDEYLSRRIEDIEAEIEVLTAPGTSQVTWKRFLKGTPVRDSTFKACCSALGLKWQDVTDQAPLETDQKVIGVQVKYLDPKDYVGLVWTQLIPEVQNVDKRHMITINWGCWCWQQVKTLPADGLILCYRKISKDQWPRVVTVSTFADRSKNRVTSITSATKIVNTHVPFEHVASRLNINRGWEERWQDPPNIETGVVSKQVDQSL